MRLAGGAIEVTPDRQAPARGVRVFYRIVHTDPPEVADFLSNAAKGKRPRRPTPDVLRLWDGISVYDILRQARITAQTFPHLGRHIAILHVPDDGSVQFAQTLDPAKGHFTLWGDPVVLRKYVTGMARLDVVN